MRAITKGREPRSLVAYRREKHSNYDKYRDKDALRKALATEQRWLCCYCMGRIGSEANEMKIEHWRSQSRYPSEQLNYRNLLGACRGGEGQPRGSQHCDTRKGDADLLWNPADPAHMIETRVRYDPDGAIRSDDDAFDAQLNDILNLNLAFLRNNRKAVLDSLLQWWREQPKPAPRSRIERQRRKFAVGNGDLAPYCQVAIWWLDRKLAKMLTVRRHTG